MQPATTRALFAFTDPQMGNAGDAVFADSRTVRHFCRSVSQREGMHEEGKSGRVGLRSGDELTLMLTLYSTNIFEYSSHSALFIPSPGSSDVFTVPVISTSRLESAVSRAIQQVHMCTLRLCADLSDETTPFQVCLSYFLRATPRHSSPLPRHTSSTRTRVCAPTRICSFEHHRNLPSMWHGEREVCLRHSALVQFPAFNASHSFAWAPFMVSLPTSFCACSCPSWS